MKLKFRPSIKPTTVQLGRIVAANAAFWLTLCLIGATGSYSDAQRNHDAASLLHLLGAWCVDHVAVCMLGIALHLVNLRWPDYFFDVARVAAGYGLVLAVFLPCDLLVLATHILLTEGNPFTFTDVCIRVMEMRRTTWFTEFAWTSGTYIGVVTICVWRRQRANERAWLQAERDNLSLRLQILRGQLEPHFMFNALNAISALVRSEDRPLALSGIRRLSDLLRYALAASDRDWVTVADELQFTRDYLSLQQLRYRNRLLVRIEGDSGNVMGGDCPPLLLQPLVENALRHGVDRHSAQGEVRITFSANGQELWVKIVNSVVADAPANPGAGTGLPNARARLRMAFGASASLRAEPEDDRFVAEIRMPMYGSEAVLNGTRSAP